VREKPAMLLLLLLLLMMMIMMTATWCCSSLHSAPILIFMYEINPTECVRAGVSADRSKRWSFGPVM